MDFSRIASLIDISRMERSTLTVVGTGGGANLCRNLVRCGIGTINLVDFDTVEAVNICRQEHADDAIGTRKVDALAAEVRRINPQVRVRTYARNFCSFADEEIDDAFGDTDVFAFCVDNLPANARGNEVALRLRKAAVWSAVYPRGRGGEVVFWHPGLVSCYRCLCSARYRAFERGEIVASATDSADVLAVQFVDSIAGMILVGLLTADADNFYGRLINDLGDRNFLHVKVHDWTWRGRDVIREQLGIGETCDAFYAWNTAARRDPTGGEPPCPDCIKHLGRRPAAA